MKYSTVAALSVLGLAACSFEGYSKRKPRRGKLANHQKMDDIKACEDGDLEGCYEAGKRLCYLGDDGYRTDRYEPHPKYPNTGYYDGEDCREGAHRLEYACDEGHGPSCFLAGKLILDSNAYDATDEERTDYAARVLLPGCEEGHKGSCELLRKLALELKWYPRADWADAKLCEINKCYPGAEAGPAIDLLAEDSATVAFGGGYGRMSDGELLDATEGYYFDTRMNVNLHLSGNWLMITPIRARIGSSDVGGIIEDGEATMGLAYRFGHLALGMATGLGLAMQVTEEEPNLGASLRLPLVLHGQLTYGRTALIAQASFGAASGDDWQDGSDKAPSGDYLSTDISLWTPPLVGDWALSLTGRYDEFGGIEMYSVAVGIGVAASLQE